jgi:hypothetical protein
MSGLEKTKESFRNVIIKKLMVGKPFVKLNFLMFLIWTIKGLRKIKNPINGSKICREKKWTAEPIFYKIESEDSNHLLILRAAKS